jgi:glycosyltransferase involved in cell wall biosynthesis
MERTFAPVCLFVYKRLETLEKTVSSLKKNTLCKDTDLYVFSDAAKNEDSNDAVARVRDYIRYIGEFKSVTIRCAPENKGLADSIISGVSSVIGHYGKVIVLEDDLVVAPNFLKFMNDALDYYQDQPKVFSISGYSSPIQGWPGLDVYFTLRASSWGWATWNDRWNRIDWEVGDFAGFDADTLARRQFNAMGSDLAAMLKKQMQGKINSWAIRWVYHQFKHKLFTVFPIRSKVSNEGFGDGATHTLKLNDARFQTVLDRSGQADFKFLKQPHLNPDIIRQFVRPYTLQTRIFYKLRTLLHV